MGYRLKALRKGLEKESTKATDDEIEINLDLDDLVVHLWRSNTPGTIKRLTHKDVTIKRSSGVGFNN